MSNPASPLKKYIQYMYVSQPHKSGLFYKFIKFCTPMTQEMIIEYIREKEGIEVNEKNIDFCQSMKEIGF